MASGARKITVEFLGNDKTLSSTAEKAGNSTSRLGDRMRKVGKIAAIGLAAGVVVAGKALFDMGKAAAQDAQSQAILSKALKNSAGATDGQVAATEKWISAQGKALGVTDDKLRPALANLARATGDVGKAQKLASLAMDISAGTGKDLGAVSLALAKAHNGNVGALGRLGIATKDANGKTLSFEQMQAKLGKTFKGSASANAETFSGKMARLRLMFDEVRESIGAKLLPVAERLATWFVNVGLPAISRFADFLRTTLGPVFERIRTVISNVLSGVRGDVSTNLSAVRSTITSVVSIIQSLWARFGDTITAYVVKTWANVRKVIGGALQVISGIFKIFAALLKGDWAGVWNGIKQVTSGAAKVITGLVGQMMNILKTAFRVGFSALKGIVGGAWNAIKSLTANGVNAVMSAIRAIPGKVRAVGGAFLSAGSSLISKLFQGIASAAKRSGGFISNLASQLISAVKRAINSALNLPLTVSFNKGPININATLIPAFAKGTNFAPGGMALVGEQGPEIVNLRRGSSVTPAGETRRLMAGGGDNFTVVAPIQIQLDAKNVWQGLLKMKRQDGIVSLGLA